MDLHIEGRHFKVTDSIQDHVKEKLGKLERYFDGIHRVHAILSLEKTQHTVDLVCTVAKRHTLVAKGDAEDLYSAVDDAEKKMVTEIKKYKAKLRPIVRGKRPAPEATVGVEGEAEEAEE
jgi:putative sigma-54 modulation protein